MLKIYDISRPISPAIGVWPGDTPFSYRWVMRIKGGGSCNVSTITMSTHTGAHTDAPSHFDDQGATIDQIPLEKYIGPATVVAIHAQEKIEVKDLELLDFTKIKRILFKTTASFLDDGIFPEGFVYLSEEAAEFLGSKNLSLVGTDAPSIDAFDSKELRTHKALLRRNVAILEGIHLAQVPPGNYELIALPLKLQGLDSSPVRAILRSL